MQSPVSLPLICLTWPQAVFNTFFWLFLCLSDCSFQFSLLPPLLDFRMLIGFQAQRGVLFSVFTFYLTNSIQSHGIKYPLLADDFFISMPQPRKHRVWLPPRAVAYVWALLDNNAVHDSLALFFARLTRPLSRFSSLPCGDTAYACIFSRPPSSQYHRRCFARL